MACSRINEPIGVEGEVTGKWGVGGRGSYLGRWVAATLLPSRSFAQLSMTRAVKPCHSNGRLCAASRWDEAAARRDGEIETAMRSGEREDGVGEGPG